MPIPQFPFTTYTPGAPPRAMLPVRIYNPDNGKFIDGLGLIDTGADECAIPADYAPLLGHDLKKGRKKPVTTGGGVVFAFGHTTRIDILDKRGTSKVLHTIPDAPIDFMPELKTILLGVNNFLSHFVLIVDYPRQQFSIKRPNP